MIEELKALTESNVTTKALIKGGYLAVDLGKQLDAEKQKRQEAEMALAALEEKVQAFVSTNGHYSKPCQHRQKPQPVIQITNPLL
ncbi:hypothetical protein JCM19237_6471 [Photobacterium aphoticum]|uniref:Uncharacterized protein n=1 Tax=Photobacterium aphoticum TaxID=754436 RepID=A0A090R7I3_9GAMM|nr:hypothetical protein JCM19237_6471 [Photobacterium aphoticum]